MKRQILRVPVWVIAVILSRGKAGIRFTQVAEAADDPLWGTAITTDLTLTGDLDCNETTGTAITLGADGVTLDRQDHAIVAPATSTVIAVGGKDGKR